MQILRGGKQWPAPLIFSPDGRYLAADTDPVFPDVRTLRVWDLEEGERIRVVSAPYYSLLAFGSDSEHLIAVRDARVGRHDLRTGRFREDKFLTRFAPLAVSPDGRFAITESHVPFAEGEADWVTGYLTVRAARNEEGKWVNAWRTQLAYSPLSEDDRGFSHLLISSGGRFVAWVHVVGAAARPTPQTEVHLLDAQTGDVVIVPPQYLTWRDFLPRLPNKAAAGPTGALAIVKGRSLYAVDPNDTQSAVVKRTNSTTKHFTDLAFSPDGRRLATVSRDSAVTVWDTTTWEIVRQHEWKIGPLRSVCFAPDGLRCAAGSETGQVVVWDLDE